MTSIDGLIYSAAMDAYIMQGSIGEEDAVGALYSDLSFKSDYVLQKNCAAGDYDDDRKIMLCPSNYMPFTLFCTDEFEMTAMPTAASTTAPEPTNEPSNEPTKIPSTTAPTRSPTDTPTMAATGYKVNWKLVFAQLAKGKFDEIEQSLKKVISAKSGKAMAAIELIFTASSRRRRLNGGTVAAEIVADDQSDMNSVSNTLSSVTTADFNLALNDQYATDGITDGPAVESLGSPVTEADAATTGDGSDDSSNSTVIIVVVVLVVLIVIAAAGIGGYMYMNQEEQPKQEAREDLELGTTDSLKRGPEMSEKMSGGASLDGDEGGEAGGETLGAEGGETTTM
eukprot:UN21306